MISPTIANYTINIGIHVMVLFSFLTIFFFVYISSLEKQNINKALDNLVNQQISSILYQVETTLHPSSDEWKNLDNIAKQMQKDAQGELPAITRNNRLLIYYGIGCIVTIFIVIVGLYFYYTNVLHIDINLTHIIMENSITFMFIGVIEFLFFTYIASQYIPVPPDVATTTVLERAKHNINEYLLSAPPAP